MALLNEVDVKAATPARQLVRIMARQTTATRAAAREVLEASGELGWRSLLSWRRVLPFLGPAFIAGVAYVDPGNFATNIAAGSQFGLLLLWVIVASNLMAVLVQTLSAKLGIATGKSLPQHSASFPTPVRYSLWVVAELGAIATDLAEFLGAALGLNLLFGMPLTWAAALTGVVTFAMLGLQRFGFRPLEMLIMGMVGVIALAYAAELIFAPPQWGSVLASAFVPHLNGQYSLVLATGILGATVMPHVVHLHSSLTAERITAVGPKERRSLFRLERIDIWAAMLVAGLINAAMLIMAATVFHATGHSDVGTIENAFQTLEPVLGKASSIVFGVALLASGLSSSAVGTLAGQVIMEGFVGWTIPLWMRRLITMAPALIIIWLGANPTQTLVASQVVLSFVLPTAIIPLVLFTSNARLMGSLVNSRLTTTLAWAVIGIIVVLNAALLWLTFTGHA
jgi:manganese transport protein